LHKGVLVTADLGPKQFATPAQLSAPGSTPPSEPFCIADAYKAMDQRRAIKSLIRVGS